MNKDFTRKLAFDKLKADYRDKYLAAIIVEAAVAFLKIAAILIPSFYIAYRIGEPGVGGGPASLIKICAIGLSMMVGYFSARNVKNERIRLEKEYKQQRNFLYFKLNG